jgi:hypothetical protein
MGRRTFGPLLFTSDGVDVELLLLTSDGVADVLTRAMTIALAARVATGMICQNRGLRLTTISFSRNGKCFGVVCKTTFLIDFRICFSFMGLPPFFK